MTRINFLKRDPWLTLNLVNGRKINSPRRVTFAAERRALGYQAARSSPVTGNGPAVSTSGLPLLHFGMPREPVQKQAYLYFTASVKSRNRVAAPGDVKLLV